MDDIERSILDFYVRENETLKEKVQLLEKQLKQLESKKKETNENK